MLMDHSGKELFGSQTSAIGNALADSKVENCYAGTCHGEMYTGGMGKRSPNTNIYTTHGQMKWNGLNPGKTGIDGMFPEGYVHTKGGEVVDEYAQGTSGIRIGSKYGEGTSGISAPKAYKSDPGVLTKEEWIKKAIAEIKKQKPNATDKEIKSLLDMDDNDKQFSIKDDSNIVYNFKFCCVLSHIFDFF